MATLDDVRRICLGLEGTKSGEDGQAFSVLIKGKPKGYVWVWRERIDPKKPKVPNLGVVAVRVADASTKEILLGIDPEKIFTEPHYNGYPAVLVRLATIEMSELEDLLIEGWKATTPTKR